MQVTPVFKALWHTQKRINCVRGGTRSSKSYSLTQIAALFLISGWVGKHYFKTGNFAIVRATFPVLRSTVMRDFINIIWEMGYGPYIEHKKSLNEFHFRGREVLFFSLDTPEKLRGRQNTIFWINEVVDGFQMEYFNQLIFRNEAFCYMDYNPEGEPFVKTEIEELRAKKEKDVFVHVSTYKQNPFLPEAMIKEIEGLKHRNKDLYDIYTRGIWVKRSGQIFPKFDTFKEWPEIPGAVYWGLDFGFSNDPSVLVEVRVYETEKKIFVNELMYGTGILTSDIAAAIHSNNCGRVICDASDPRTIDDLRRRGCRVQASYKGADSIVNGINRLLQYDLFLKGENIENDFKKYTWRKDNAGNNINAPEDKNNHAPDAVRYSISYSMRAKTQLI